MDDEIEPFVVDNDPSFNDLDLGDDRDDLGDVLAAAAFAVQTTTEEPPPEGAAPAGEIQLFNPATGVVAPVVDARRLLACAGLLDPDCEDIEAALGETPFDALVQFAANGGDALAVFKEAVNLALYELPNRLDGRGLWTIREHGFVVNAPSPEAGTLGYDSAKLREALATLVADKVIEQAGADRALESVPAQALVPYGLLRALCQALDGEADMPTVERLRTELGDLVQNEPEPRLVQHPNGIKALIKLPGAREAIEACQIELTPPKRRATVKPIPLVRS